QAADGDRRDAGPLRDPGAQRRPARAPARTPAAQAHAAGVRVRGMARRPAGRAVERRAVRQRGDRRAADAALQPARRRGVRGTRRAGRRRRLCAHRPARRPAAVGGGAPRRARARRAAARRLSFRAAAAAAVLAAGGGRRPGSRRDAVRRLRPSAPRVLRARAQRRDPARVPPPPRQRRRVRAPGAAGHHRLGRFHRAGRGRDRRRLRLRRLLLAGQPADRQRPGAAAGGAGRPRRGRGRPLRAAPAGQAADLAGRDGRALPGDGVCTRGRVRRRVPGRRPELSPVTTLRGLKPLRHPSAWLALWWLAVVLVFVACLVPAPELPSVPRGFDKLEYFLAFFLLAASAVQLYATRRALWYAALGLLALGIAIELAQYAFTASRSMDPRD